MPLCDKKLGMTHTNDFCEKKSDKVTTFFGQKKNPGQPAGKGGKK
jgi:hypothetical protein